mmetsp:Transcript_10786/g.10908  ORF Transcript_10786/g.10908 Transcript_10786/m.10908 type:complete len:130 (-) Transcript_10786:531-920(-)
MSISFTLEDRPGILQQVLGTLAKHNVNMTSINSKPPKLMRDTKEVDFFIDCEGNLEHPSIKKALRELEMFTKNFSTLNYTVVPWFPTKPEDLEASFKRSFSSDGPVMNENFPGSKDPDFLARRDYILAL